VADRGEARRAWSRHHGSRDGRQCLRNGLPTVVWDRDAGVASEWPIKALRSPDRSRTRSRGSTWSSPWSPMPRGDGNRRRSRHAGGASCRRRLGTNEHDRRRGDAAIARSSRSSAPMSCSSTRPCREARFPRAGEADHLCLWDRRGAATAEPFFAAIGQRTVWLGDVGLARA